MHGDSILLATFVTALVAAFLGDILARAARLPPVVGYLLGGLAVGPFTPGFIGDSHAMSQLAEVGVMFMMFGTGLHFSFDDLVAVRALRCRVLAANSPRHARRLWAGSCSWLADRGGHHARPVRIHRFDGRAHQKTWPTRASPTTTGGRHRGGMAHRWRT